MKLSRISLAILPLLSLCSVQAAVYNVVEIGEVSEVKSTYAAAINDAGSVVVNGLVSVAATDAFGRPFTDVQLYNFPLDLDAIDFESATVIAALTDEQLADAINGNIDATVIAQAPKLAAHMPAMCQRIAQALDIDVSRVNVKAKTAEKIGPVGQGLSMEARAVALIY